MGRFRERMGRFRANFVGRGHSCHARVCPGERTVVLYVRAARCFLYRDSPSRCSHQRGSKVLGSRPRQGTQVASRTLSTAGMPPSRREASRSSSRRALSRPRTSRLLRMHNSSSTSRLALPFQSIRSRTLRQRFTMRARCLRMLASPPRRSACQPQPRRHPRRHPLPGQEDLEELLLLRHRQVAASTANNRTLTRSSIERSATSSLQGSRTRSMPSLSPSEQAIAAASFFVFFTTSSTLQP